MIRIRKGPKPPLFNSYEMEKAISSFERNQYINISERRQRRAPIVFPFLEQIKKALLSESHGKCVYCERKLSATNAIEVERFRPARGAVDDHGNRSEEHYYWLAFEWTNLYASCRECNVAKGAKFPVAATRIPTKVLGDFDSIEEPMILNPGSVDPDAHLRFEIDGTVAPKSIHGQFTIDILRLNRPSLVKARVLHIEKFSNRLDLRAINDTSEFSAMTRQLLPDILSLFAGKAHDPAPLISAEQRQLTREEQEEARRKYYSSFPLISSIEINGLFGLSDVKINIPNNPSGKPGCLALLGENGVGKSSILKCIALVLYDQNALKNLSIEVRDFINSNRTDARIAVTFDTGAKILVDISQDDVQVKMTEVTPILFLAYGATRLLPTTQHKYVPETGMAQAANLFNPFVPLRDPVKWLGSLKENHFDYAAAAIKALLELNDNIILHRNDDVNSPISFEIFGRRHPLEELSQGYKTILALACDVMAMLFSRWESIETAQGIVLIDELENHLHPAWKLRIVDSLKSAFPRVQFIITTHDPLCLRGFGSGEVALLRRSSDENRDTVVLQSLPAVSDMRIDQILTSSFFGLRSTVDPAIEILFDEYYLLLEQEQMLDENERERLDQLKIEIARYDMPALLPRDRVMYAVIDKHLATHGNLIPDHEEEFDSHLQSLVEKIVEGLPDAESNPT